MIVALMEEYNTAFKVGNYRAAEALAVRARELDPDNATLTAAVDIAHMQARLDDFRQSQDHGTPNGPTPAPVPTGVRPLTAGVVNGVVAEDQTSGQAAAALARFQGDFKAGRYEEAKIDALRALVVAPGHPVAVAALQQACEALSRQPRPEAPPQCTYVGTGLRPPLRPVDPAVVSALQKLLIEGDKTGPAGGAEEAEPKDETVKPAPRR
jgi:hypothetical protein